MKKKIYAKNLGFNILYRRIIPIILLISFSLSVFSQNSSKNKVFQIKSGEIVTYKAYYNWRFIWLKAGSVIFSVSDILFQNQEAFKFSAKGWSLKEYDWFFKVRDSFETTILKKNQQPLTFLRNTYEGGYRAYNRYSFNFEDSTLHIESYTSKRPFKAETKKLQPNTFDVLSAVYHFRQIDFTKYSIGEKIPINIAIDNDIYPLYIRYMGKEIITLKNGETYKTLKFKIKLVEGTIFTGGEDMTIWVTDNNLRIPVLVEAKILIGSVKAILNNYSN